MKTRTSTSKTTRVTLSAVILSVGVIIAGCKGKDASTQEGKAAPAPTAEKVAKSDEPPQVEVPIKAATDKAATDKAATDKAATIAREAANAAEEAWVLYEGPIEGRNLAKAVEQFQRACDAENADGCTGLGLAYLDGKGVPVEPEKAVPLLTRACDGGSLRGCNGLANAYLDGQGIAMDEAKARSLYQRACDGNEVRGCINLAPFYTAGRGVPKDHARAFSLYERACKGGRSDGCFWTGVAYKRGQGVTRSCSKGDELIRTACNDEKNPVSAACIDLALSLARGTCDKHKDMAESIRYSKRACELSKADCGLLGAAYVDGNGIRRDKKEGIRLLTESCSADSADGCAILAEYYRIGRGVPRLPAEAAALLKKACDLGHDLSCQSAHR